MDKSSIEPPLSLLEYWPSDPYPSPIANCHYLEPFRFDMVSYNQTPHVDCRVKKGGDDRAELQVYTPLE